MNQIRGRKSKWTVVVAATAVFVLAYPHLQAAIAGSIPVVDAARTLAENVLGSGSIKSLRSAHGGNELLIRWESPTYRESYDRAYKRELMYGEAVLTSNAIIGQLQQVIRIRFVIVKGDRMLATGETWRARGVSLTFGTDLGGGVYVAPVEPKTNRSKPSGKESQAD